MTAGRYCCVRMRQHATDLTLDSCSGERKWNTPVLQNSAPLGGISSQLSANASREGIDAGGQRFHAGRGAQADQNEHQAIFDQVLTVLIFQCCQEHLALYVRFQNKVVHLFVLC